MSAAPARPKLAAARRAITGKKVAYLRRDGRLPAVVFGRGLSSDSVSLDTHEFESRDDGTWVELTKHTTTVGAS